MPLSKRFRDALLSYQSLYEEFLSAQQVALSAKSSYSKAKLALDSKINEILNEASSCVPSPPPGVSHKEILVELDGKTFLITNSPKDLQSEYPSYIKEVRVEKC